MAEFFDYVVCVDKNSGGNDVHLCYAPFMSFIEVGDIVMIETEIPVEVIAVGTISTNKGNEQETLKKLKKIKSRIIIQELEYKEN